MNYQGLSDFRSGHGELPDGLLSEQVAALPGSGMASLDEVAVDGTKVRASAGSGSFRGEGGLSRYEAAARVRIAALKSELESDPGAASRRVRAARARAARDMEAKVSAARSQLEALRAEKAARSRTHKKAEKAKSEPKVSTTDSQARRMRFADGAVGAGYNPQFAVGADSHVIVGVRETARRNDAGLAGEIVEQLERRYGCCPDRLPVDTRYATRLDGEWGRAGGVSAPPSGRGGEGGCQGPGIGPTFGFGGLRRCVRWRCCTPLHTICGRVIGWPEGRRCARGCRRIRRRRDVRRLAMQRHEPRDLRRARGGRGDEDAGDPRFGQDFGFAQRGAALARGAGGDLRLRDVGRFMAFRVRAQRLPGAPAMRRHRRDIPFHRIEIEHQRMQPPGTPTSPAFGDSCAIPRPLSVRRTPLPRLNL